MSTGTKSVIENYLISYGILDSGHTSAAAEILLSVQPTLDVYSYSSPAKYVDLLWSKMEGHKLFNANLRGKAFELLIACALIKAEVLPFYWQASLEFVPLANFDLVVYTEEKGPIALSCKTSIRERYKQAEFEAQALKNVHKRAKTYLLTMESTEASGVNHKRKEGILSCIDKVVVANRVEFNKLIEDLQSLTIIAAPIVSIVSSGNHIH